MVAHAFNPNTRQILGPQACYDCCFLSLRTTLESYDPAFFFFFSYDPALSQKTLGLFVFSIAYIQLLIKRTGLAMVGNVDVICHLYEFLVTEPTS